MRVNPPLLDNSAVVDSLATQQERFELRGGDWLIFKVVHPFLPQHRKRGLLKNLLDAEPCDLVLAAAKPSSQFLILFSQTIQAHRFQEHQLNHSRQLPSHAQTVEPFTNISSECWLDWRNSALPDESPTLLPKQQLQEFVGKVSVAVPTTQEFIMVNEDRASLVFSNWKDRIKTKSAWHTPLALVVTLASAIATASFSDFSWISKGTIRGFFIAALIGSMGWLLKDVVHAMRSPSTSAKDFIEDLKKGTRRTDYTSS